MKTDQEDPKNQITKPAQIIPDQKAVPPKGAPQLMTDISVSRGKNFRPVQKQY